MEHAVESLYGKQIIDEIQLNKQEKRAISIRPLLFLDRNGKENDMAKYVCDVCGWEYDEALGDQDHGIAPGTKFEDLPEDFECPLCGAGKDEFSKA